MNVDGQPKNFGQQHMLDRRDHTFEGECASYQPNIGFLNVKSLGCVSDDRTTGKNEEACL